MKKRIRLLLIAEFEAASVDDAQRQLDNFREATSPSVEYGITFWQARQGDFEVTTSIALK